MIFGFTPLHPGALLILVLLIGSWICPDLIILSWRRRNTVAYFYSSQLGNKGLPGVGFVPTHKTPSSSILQQETTTESTFRTPQVLSFQTLTSFINIFVDPSYNDHLSGHLSNICCLCFLSMFFSLFMNYLFLYLYVVLPMGSLKSLR